MQQKMKKQKIRYLDKNIIFRLNRVYGRPDLSIINRMFKALPI